MVNFPTWVGVCTPSQPSYILVNQLSVIFVVEIISIIVIKNMVRDFYRWDKDVRHIRNNHFTVNNIHNKTVNLEVGATILCKCIHNTLSSLCTRYLLNILVYIRDTHYFEDKYRNCLGSTWYMLSSYYIILLLSNVFASSLICMTVYICNTQWTYQTIHYHTHAIWYRSMHLSPFTQYNIAVSSKL